MSDDVNSSGLLDNEVVIITEVMIIQIHSKIRNKKLLSLASSLTLHYGCC